MSTAMKNILTIAVVTPTFYYFGWYIYGCMQEGWPKSGHDCPDAFPGFCGLTAPWSEGMGPNLQDHVSLVFFLAFLLFSWTTASIMSGALIERVRLSAFLLLARHARLGRLDPRRRLGLELRRLDDDPLRLPRLDRVRRRARRRRGVHARRAAQPRPADRQVRRRRPRAQLQTPQHAHDADGADAHLHRLLRLLRRLPRDPVDGLPGLAQHLPLPDDARHDRDGDHVRLRGRLHRGVVRLEGRPVLDPVRRSRGRHLRLGGRRRLPPVARLPALVHRRHGRRLGRGLDREEAPDRRRRRRRRGARLLRLLRHLPRRDLRRRLSDRDQQHRELLRRPADRDPDLPPARLPPGLRVAAGSSGR